MNLEDSRKTVPHEWKLEKIEDISELRREPFNPSENDIRLYIGLEHIGEGTLSLISFGLSSEITSGKFIFNKDDILFGKLRPYFRKVILAPFDGVCSTDIFVIKSKGNIDKKYLFYLFSSKEIVGIATNTSEGTRMPRASWHFLKKIEINIPSYEEQKRIGTILSSLDNRIKNNQQMNKTLEEIGQALFKHWFIDFEFTNEEGKYYKSKGGEMVDSELGEIPKDWKVGILDELIEITSGKRPLKKKENKDSEFYVPLIGASNVMGYVNEILYKEPILVIGRVGTHGIIQRINPPSFPSDNTLIIKSYFYEYIYYTLKRIDYNSLNVGTTQPLITQSSIKNYEILIPSENIIERFEKYSSLIHKKIEENMKEIEILNQIRDSLLPKLISGEIRVPVSESDKT